MEICLSFDNGPEPEATPGVLAVLARRRIPAMFFVIGEKLRNPKARALAEQARDAGHVIGNHTLTHGAPIRRPAACHYAVASPGRISRAISPAPERGEPARQQPAHLGRHPPPPLHRHQPPRPRQSPRRA
jgi:hypothetical protein